MRDYVFSLIEEERRLQRDERRRRSEDRRREMQELKKGPYDKYNLKVNSMAQALGLDPGQRDRYYELSKIYGEEAQELHKGVKWGDKEALKKFTKDQKQLMEDFDADMERLLTVGQLEVYRELPPWTRNPQNLGYVGPPGEQGGRGIQIMVDGMDAVQAAADGTFSTSIIHVETGGAGEGADEK
jgi:hypothetical protein